MHRRRRGDGARGGDALSAKPVESGEVFARTLRLTEAQIAAFAASVDDWNPLHHDGAAALAAGYPGLIASGTHVGSVLMAMTASHFSTPAADGTPRSSLGLGFRLKFHAAVLADEDMQLKWTVSDVERKESLRGWIVRLEGDACSLRGPLITVSGEILLRLGDERLAPSPSPSPSPVRGRGLGARRGFRAARREPAGRARLASRAAHCK